MGTPAATSCRSQVPWDLGSLVLGQLSLQSASLPAKPGAEDSVVIATFMWKEGVLRFRSGRGRDEVAPSRSASAGSTYEDW